MELEKLNKELRLMVLLTQNRELTVSELCERLDIPSRSLYRYLEAFRNMGFHVEKSGRCYRLDRSSPFFQRITELVHFTESEAVTLRNLLDAVGGTNPEIRHLKDKLARIYDGDILQQHQTDAAWADNLHQLYQAIKAERVVVLRDYRSSHSDSVSHRMVEPFQFLSRNEDIRCYEPSSGQCKTFKVGRIGRVVVLNDVKWSHADLHKELFTDIFHFSGEEQWPVTLRLDRMAAQLLREEYGVTSELQPDGDAWLFSTSVSSWKGIGRFVMGLPASVEVIDTPDFLNYLRQQPHF